MDSIKKAPAIAGALFKTVPNFKLLQYQKQFGYRS